MNQKTILIVEDNTSVVDAFTITFEDLGYKGRLLFATKLSEINQLLKTLEPVDAIFWDGNIIGGQTTNGTIEVAREKFPNCIMVAMSSDLYEKQLEQGCTLHLPKPWNLIKFMEIMEQVLAEPVLV